MAPEVDTDDLLARYVLGELSEAEEARVEERYLEDDLFFERLSLVEDELIDRYVRGESSEAERRDFEAKYLTTPRRRQKVESARRFVRLIDEATPPRPPADADARPRTNPVVAFLHNRAPALSLALAVAVGVLAFCCWWMYGETRRLRDELGQTRLALQRQAEQQQQQGGQAMPSPTAPPPAPTVQPPREQTPEVAGPPGGNLPKEGSEPQRKREAHVPRTQPPAFATFVLPPASTRGDSAGQPLVIHRGNSFVRLIMYLEENPYRKYRVSIEGAEGDTVWSANVSKGQKTELGEQIRLNLPAAVFKNHDYILRIEAQTPQNKFVSVDATSLNVVRQDTALDPRP